MPHSRGQSIEHEPVVAGATGATDGQIRAKLFNHRLGLQDIVITSASIRSVEAECSQDSPKQGEEVSILLPTGQVLQGFVARSALALVTVDLDLDPRFAGPL